MGGCFFKFANVTSISGLIVKSSHSLNDYIIKILGKLIFMSSTSFRLSGLHTTHVGFRAGESGGVGGCVVSLEGF